MFLIQSLSKFLKDTCPFFLDALKPTAPWPGLRESSFTWVGKAQSNKCRTTKSPARRKVSLLKYPQCNQAQE